LCLGGREGYDTLLNTDLGRELDHYGRFLSMVVEHKHHIGFKGTILIEPKPFEPTKHQYDRDTAAVLPSATLWIGEGGQGQHRGQPRHLAGLDFEHEIAAARTYGIFVRSTSIVVTRATAGTQTIPQQRAGVVPAMLQVIENGGLGTGASISMPSCAANRSIRRIYIWLISAESIRSLVRCSRLQT